MLTKSFTCTLRTLGVAALMLMLAAPAMAHTPIFSCFDNADGTILCQGGFSDGSSAAGTTVRLLDGSGTVINEGQIDDFSEVVFDKPEGDYAVEFDAGEGHEIVVPGSEIVE